MRWDPPATGFGFDDELLAEVAALPGVASVKVLGVPADQAPARVAELRAMLPAHVTIGVAGDVFAADGLLAGYESWYSVIAGVLPDPAVALLQATAARDAAAARRISESLAPIWQLFAEYGSARVVASIAGELGLSDADFLPRPLLPLDEAGQARVRVALNVVTR